jgi:hypothetical protein
MDSIKPRLPKKDIFTNTIFQKVLFYLNHEQTRKQFHELVLDPILQHVLEKVFPYMILTCVLFILLLVVVIITLSIMIFQIRATRGPQSV